MSKTDRDGRVTEYVYDHLGRQTAENRMNGAEPMHRIDYAYDLLGRILAGTGKTVCQ